MNESRSMSHELTYGVSETQDGTGAGDHDIPYKFGRSPSSVATYPFSTRQYARLLVFRSRVREGLRSEQLHD